MRWLYKKRLLIDFIVFDHLKYDLTLIYYSIWFLEDGVVFPLLIT
jgi:hypothetical protein